MVRRTLILNRNISTDITSFPANQNAQNGWTPIGNNWSVDWQLGLRVNSGISEGSDRLISRNISGLLSGIDDFEIEIDLSSTWAVEETIGYNTGGSNTVGIRLWNDVNNQIEFDLGSVQELMQEDGNSASLLAFVQFREGGTSTGSFHWSLSTPNPPFLSSLNRANYAFPYWAKTQVNRIKLRLVKGQKTRVWIDTASTGLWQELSNAEGDTAILPFGFNPTELRILSVRPYASQDQVLKAVRIYSIQSLDPPPPAVGMIDEDGNQILGVDPSDDGSGSNTGGEKGFGGGGVINLTVSYSTFTAEAVTSDKGLAVVGATSGDTGTLIDYDNTAKTWTIDPDDSGDVFSTAERITVTGGTGDINGTGSTIIKVVGGRYNNGLVGSGSEGNIDKSVFTAIIGTGDATAWGGSGTGINITGYSVTRILDGYGFGEIYLDIVDNYSTSLDGYKGKFFGIQEDGLTIFQGYITEVHNEGRYKARFTIKEMTFNFNELDCQRNYAQIINTFGYAYDTISAVSATTITLTNGSTSSLATDGTMAVMIIPSTEPASSDEISATNIVVRTTGSGTVSNIYTDDDNFITNVVSTSGDAGRTIELTGTYSGLVSQITAFQYTIYLSAKKYLGDNTIHVYLYDYNAPAWEEIILPAEDSGYFKIPLLTKGDLISIGYHAKEELPSINKLESESPQNYFDPSTKEFKIRIVHLKPDALVDEKIRLYYVDLEVWTDPFYEGDFFPIDNIPSSTQIRSTVDFANAGVNIGDTVVVGQRNDVVLADIVSLAYYDFLVDVDTFTGFTASDFLTQRATIADAINSVLKKENGVFYYNPELQTVFFRKRSSLDTFNTMILSNSEFWGGYQTLISEAQTKQQDQFIGIQVTGNSFKTYDNDVSIIYYLPTGGKRTNKVLRITDTSINSITEAKARALSEIALIDTVGNPAFDVEIVTKNEIPEKIYTGSRVGVRYHGGDYTDVPIRTITFSRFGNEYVTINLEMGWKGTSYLDRDIDDSNDVRKRIRLLENASRNRSSPVLANVVTVFGDHIIISNITQITNRSHTDLSSIGTNTHAAIDTHLLNEPAAAIGTHEGNPADINHLTDAQVAALHDIYTDAEVDAIVATHTAIVDAHHTKYTDAEVDAIIAIHTAITTAHHTKTVSSEIDHTAISNRGTNAHTAIDTHLTDEPAAAITTHTGVPAAHHTKTTSSEIDHAAISNRGTNAHTTIDTHLGSSGNPHAVTQSQVGLANVDNVADVNQVSLGTVTAGDAKAIDSIGLITSKAGGDIFYWNASLQRLAKGTNGYVLKLNTGLPAWEAEGGGSDPNAIHDNVANEINIITEKTTLVANDEFVLEDSAASGVKKSAKVSAIRITESQITDLTHDDLGSHIATQDLDINSYEILNANYIFSPSTTGTVEFASDALATLIITYLSVGANQHGKKTGTYQFTFTVGTGGDDFDNIDFDVSVNDSTWTTIESSGFLTADDVYVFNDTNTTRYSNAKGNSIRYRVVATGVALFDSGSFSAFTHATLYLGMKPNGT